MMGKGENAGTILEWSKFKAFADDKINMTEKMKFTLNRIENIVGKEKKHFFHFQHCFQKASDKL